MEEVTYTNWLPLNETQLKVHINRLGLERVVRGLGKVDIVPVLILSEADCLYVDSNQKPNMTVIGGIKFLIASSALAVIDMADRFGVDAGIGKEKSMPQLIPRIAKVMSEMEAATINRILSESTTHQIQQKQKQKALSQNRTKQIAASASALDKLGILPPPQQIQATPFQAASPQSHVGQFLNGIDRRSNIEKLGISAPSQELQPQELIPGLGCEPINQPSPFEDLMDLDYPEQFQNTFTGADFGNGYQIHNQEQDSVDVAMGGLEINDSLQNNNFPEDKNFPQEIRNARKTLKKCKRELEEIAGYSSTYASRYQDLLSDHSEAKAELRQLKMKKAGVEVLQEVEARAEKLANQKNTAFTADIEWKNKKSQAADEVEAAEEFLSELEKAMKQAEEIQPSLEEM